MYRVTAHKQANRIEDYEYDLDQHERALRQELDNRKELEAKLAKAVEALKECEEEIDAYIQYQYPHDHPVQERYRQQDYATNLARVALAELKGETE